MEIWKCVPGVPYLEASSLGRIKSVKRSINNRVYPDRILSISTKRGYSIVEVTRNGIVKNYFVHRLVLSAFIGIADLPVDHINGIRTDNRPENLEYVTAEENTRRYHLNSNRKLPMGVKLKRGKYVASIQVYGIEHHLGVFKTPEEAAAVYNSALEIPDDIPELKERHKKKATCIYQKGSRYVVLARKDKKPVRLGSYSTKEEAQQVLDDWRNSL